MLVKKVKVVAPDGAEPSMEERYILTADINRMADLVGLSSNIVKDVLKRALDNPNNTYYGEAHTADYFHNACNAWENIKPGPRKFDLDHIHLRVSDRVKTDASGSFLIVPVSITAPLLVGDVSKGYELIPHIVLESHEPDNYSKVTTHASIFRPSGDSFVHEQVKSASDNVDFRLVGFDLLLLDQFKDPDVLPKVFRGEVYSPGEPTYNPNTMVYDFGFGVCLHYEVDIEKDVIKLTAYRGNRMVSEPVIETLSLTGKHTLAEPLATLCKVIEHASTSNSGKPMFPGSGSEYNATDTAMLRFITEMNRRGFEGIGWRN